MKKLALQILLIVSTLSYSQLTKNLSKSTKETDDIVNLLVQNFGENPENPLKIDKNLLTNFSQLITDQNLKNTLLSYSNNLGTDSDLSLRQVYWDLSNAFKINPSIATNEQFNNTAQGLKMMFDSSNNLANKLQTNEINFQLGSFINNPSIIKSFQNISGSFESAQALGLGIDLLAGLLKGLEANQKYKDDYRKLAKLSSENIYVETDVNLNSALIDANVGIENFQMITPIYRYDFNNGNSLRVEKGILKYFNTQKGIVKNLMIVDKRHDGKFYNYNDLRISRMSTIIISSDEKTFYIYYNQKAISDIKCKDCLKATGYVISTENGEILYTRWGTKLWRVFPEYCETLNSSFNDNNVLMSTNFMATGEYNYVSSTSFVSDDKIAQNIGFSCNLDGNKKFNINNQRVNFIQGNKVENMIFDRFVKTFYSFPKDNTAISLFWAKEVKASNNGLSSTSANEIGTDEAYVPLYSSSMLQIPNNPDGMVNELTGITMKKNGDLYFVNKNGAFGKLAGTQYKLTDTDLTSKIRAALKGNNFSKFNFIANKSYISSYGNIENYLSSEIPNYPSLMITPDEKIMTYIVYDNLYVIDANNTEKVNHYKLTFQPSNYYFTKELGEWVINFQAMNEFKFPITKKYSLEKLNSIAVKKKGSSDLPSKNENFSKTKNSNNESSNFSLANEIKKLKELLDSGAITEDEYKVAKSKLLNTTNKKK